MTSDINGIVARALSRAEVDPAVPLYDYGMDSFTALRIRSEIRDATGTSLPITVLLGDLVTVESIIDALGHVVPGQIPPP